ncbi:hypothetical protein EXIGLDRAFT_775157 [Exidia glandulosa HHB12029]|uniref:Uncharacterized protein n=1 Tax=Exidia glandulosa HHB12029 TaxID=1314781 RepID=A0A165E1X0_EXIGL|nr:hypothetical protein EXIGLDRAFT_775157 [Exidia glandulosa HHB12029]
MPVTHNHTTIEHTLAKFSSKQRKSDGSQADWVHWASPTLLISLAVSTALDGGVAAAQLAVVWRRNQDSATNRGEITLEELDLLSFSNIAPSPLQLKPLRAVYSGTVVGIRYLHPLRTQLNSQSSFNQIQVRFQDASDASQFVAALSRFCPCKEETARPAGATMGPPASRQIPVSRAPSIVKRPTMAPASRPTIRYATPSFDALNMSSSPPVPASSASSSRTSTPAPAHSSAVPPERQGYFGSTETSQFDLAFQSEMTLSSGSQIDPTAPPAFPSVPVPSAAPVSTTALSNNPALLPSRSSSVVNAMLMDTTSDETQAQAQTQTQAHVSSTPARQTVSEPSVPPVPAASASILATVREIPALFQLTTPDLERAIGEIVREPGFLEFLGRVEGMWRVRGLVGR